MTKEELEKTLNPLLEEKNLFLVELTVSPEGKIGVYADGFTSISIDQCAEISRFLRNTYGEALDNYEIIVSSPGLEKPFRHFKQYLKNLDKNVEVVLNDGKKIAGKLNVADPEFIVVQEFKPMKGNNKSLKPQLSDINTRIEFNQIKQTKKMIIF